MSMSFVAFELSIAIFAGAIGWWVLPYLAHRMLVYKYHQITSYWISCLADYRTLSPDKQLPHALELWLDDSYRLISQKALAREYANELAACNQTLMDQYDLESLPNLATRTRIYCEPFLYSWRALCAGANALAALALTIGTFPAPAALAAWIVLCVCLVMALIDAKAHILPFELTLALVPLGIAFQVVLIFTNLTTITSSIIGTAIYCLILFGAVGLTQFITKLPATGRGDVRATPGFALLCATSPFLSLGATALSMGLALIVFRLRKLKTATDSVPFGPFLTIGTAVGMIFNALGIL